MKNKLINIKTIGISLAALYAISLWVFLLLFRVPQFEMRNYIYALLFLALLIGSMAVIYLREWGRRTVLIANGILLACLAIRYLPTIDVVPFSYFIMCVIIFLYFTQQKVKIQFIKKEKGVWQSVLIVDDDPSVLKIVRQVLISSSFSVLTASTGEEGLQIAKSQKPDLIVLDVILPGIKGREVCKKLKEDPETADIPVVFLTAKDSADDVKAEIDAGAIAHLTKPVNSKILTNTIKDILSSSK